ncbi:MAG: IPExxxVDY family protein [Bacteroidetes bacterium]|nr:IPExxxVDY family protein [Bacteroidota bacterium]
MNRKTLKFEIDLDFALIAITTSLRDYRLCHYINKRLHFNFAKSPDLELMQNNIPVYFSLYQYHWEASDTDFYFIGNKGSEGYLIPEMRKVDYFIMIRNYITDDELEKLVSDINRMQEVVAAVKVDPKKIKSRENLLLF